MVTSHDFKSLDSTRQSMRTVRSDVENSTYINVKRLQLLADYLDKHVRLYPDHFSMDEWFEVNNSPYVSNNTQSVRTRKDLNRPNVTACAIGWATMIPQFRRQGFKPYFNQQVKLNTLTYYDKDYVTTYYGNLAVNKFFCIYDTVSLWMFQSKSYKSRKIGIDCVINRINFVIATYKKANGK